MWFLSVGTCRGRQGFNMPSTRDEDTMRNAALRHALANLDPVSGRALMHLAKEARRGMQAAGTYDGPVSRLVDGLVDMGRYTSAHAAADEMGGEDAVALEAFRYSIGRMTSVVRTCSEWLPEVWEKLAPDTRDTIVAETREALATGRAGHDCDRHAWSIMLEQVGHAPAMEAAR